MDTDAVAPTGSTEVAAFRRQLDTIRWALRINVEGVTHEESLIPPQPAGNCLNFVVGHLVHQTDDTLLRLGREPALERGALARYARGAAPLVDPAEAWPLDALMAAWDDGIDRLDRALAEASADDLDAPGPFGGGSTVRDFVAFVLFHQAYHAGQAGLLRRLAGKAGAIP